MRIAAAQVHQTWAPGDGNGLRVHAFTGREGDSMRAGGLNCWENRLPQARLLARSRQSHLTQ